MKKKYLFILILVSLFACNRNNVKPDVATHISDSLKKYFYYKPGTYWIYKDSISGRRDSFVVVKTDSFATILEVFSTPAHLQQCIDIYVDEYNLDSSGASVYHWKWSLIGAGAYVNLLTGPLFFHPFIIGQAFPFMSDECLLTNIFASYAVNGNNFSNVAEINHYNNDSIPIPPSYSVLNRSVPYNDWFYINNGAGIIKMRINNSPDSIHHVWELQRYKMLR